VNEASAGPKGERLVQLAKSRKGFQNASTVEGPGGPRPKGPMETGSTGPFGPLPSRGFGAF
jgi:hypothetical protein